MPISRIVDELEFKDHGPGKAAHLDDKFQAEPPDGEIILKNEVAEDEPPHVVLDTEKGKDDVVTAKAKKFLDLVRKGVTPGDAAKKVGMSLAQLRRTKVKKRIEDLTIAYHLPDEIRKLLVKNGLNRLFMMNLGKKDVANQKLLLDTIKQMASDPDVGLQSNQQVGIQINLGELGELLKNVPKDVVIEDINITGE